MDEALSDVEDTFLRHIRATPMRIDSEVGVIMMKLDVRVRFLYTTTAPAEVRPGPGRGPGPGRIPAGAVVVYKNRTRRKQWPKRLRTWRRS